MKVVITGGGGFIGSQLAAKLLKKGQLSNSEGKVHPIEQLLLFDRIFPDAVAKWANQQGSVTDLTLLTGDISSREEVENALSGDLVSVFHLAAMVSGECEVHFDDAMAVNLDGTHHVVESLRNHPGCPRLVFASSVGTYGGEDLPETVADSTKQIPQTTYGMTKVIGELLVNDYSRKGFLDGRSVRLPTVIIRPGQPNAAASSWASGMFREPLAGETCHLPVHRDQLHPVIGYRDVIDAFIALHETPAERLGADRAFTLPSHRITVGEGLTLLEQVADERGIPLGMVLDHIDPVVQAIVDTWPTATDGSRALALGLPRLRSVEQIIRDYIDDFLDP
ncbi:MAG: NAD-dependent epimerase/dehydratase family protein [Verrucomicrobiota bacterium]